MEHSLQLVAPLDMPGVEKMLRALGTVAGVRAVQAAAGDSQVNVQYDDNLTSPQEISTTLMSSGFPLQQPARRSGGCGGGCGGH